MQRVRIRPLEATDNERLAPLTAALDGPVRLTRGAASFYARSGHAFVAEDAHGPRGLVLAQAVWDGTRGSLRIAALDAAAPAGEAGDRPGAPAVRAALLEAATKSAYDAAVYDLTIEAPEADADLLALLERERWRSEPVRLLRRTLGSRGDREGTDDS